MDGVVFKLGEDRFWFVQADGPFEEWLLALSSGFDVTISDPSSRVLQIQGPASIAIMNAASGGMIDDTMRYFRSGYFDLGGQNLYVSRTGFTNELGLTEAWQALRVINVADGTNEILKKTPYHLIK